MEPVKMYLFSPNMFFKNQNFVMFGYIELFIIIIFINISLIEITSINNIIIIYRLQTKQKIK